MWLALLVLAELTFLYYWLTNYAVALFLLCYLLWYLDGSEYTGRRRWGRFRTLRLWRRFNPVDYVMTPEFQTDSSPRLYVALPGDTYVPLIWGFGLHGGRLADTMSDRLLYVVPQAYMWVPLLRDVLLWSGAICHLKKKPSLTELLQHAIVKETCSVAFYASMTSDTWLSPSHRERDVNEDEVVVKTQPVSDEMLGFVLERGMSLCVVVVCKEHERYWIAARNWFQSWERTRHPFPLLCCYRGYFARRAPPKVLLQFGPMQLCTRIQFPTTAALKQDVEATVEAMCNKELNDDVLKLN